jgi:hypothetical protein
LTEDDLDLSYGALREGLAAVGGGKGELFLSMVCLALMARYESAADVLALIGNVRAQCAAEASEAGEGVHNGFNTHESGSLRP